MSGSFTSERIVKSTRKPHRCAWCGQRIDAGSKALASCGLSEGFFSGHLHLECAAACEAAEWVRGEGYEIWAQARGRTDDDTNAPPEFTPEDYETKRAEANR